VGSWYLSIGSHLRNTDLCQSQFPYYEKDGAVAHLLARTRWQPCGWHLLSNQGSRIGPSSNRTAHRARKQFDAWFRWRSQPMANSGGPDVSRH